MAESVSDERIESAGARRSHADAIAGLGERALALEDLTTFLAEAVDYLARMLGAARCEYLEAAPDGGVTLVLASDGSGGEIASRPEAHGGPDSFAGCALTASEPVVVGDWSAERRFEVPSRLAAQGVLSSMAAPAAGAERSLGVVAAHARRAGAFDRGHVEVLKASARLIAAAIERRASGDVALKRSLKELSDIRAALDASAIVAITDQTGKITYVNDKFCEISKYSREELIGQDHRIINSNYHPKEFIRGLWTTIASGRVWKGQLRNRAKDGSFYWVDTTIVPFLNSRGKPYQYVAIRFDITEHKRAEEQIHEQAALLDKARDAIVARGLDDRVVFWNKGAERLYGWTAQEAVGRKMSEVIREARAPLPAEAERRLFETGDWSGELSQLTKEGKEVIVESRWSLVRDERDQPKSVLVINTDITERKKLEGQFLRAQRTESIGTLAGGIAHDLNNVLAPILTAVQMLQMKFTDEESQRFLALLRTNAERGSDLVKQVLAFARGVEGSHIPLDPRHVIKDVIRILRDTLPKSIEIQFSLPDDLWIVSGDATQLHQVLMNLCVNARDAMPHGGRLSIRAENMEIDENYARMNLEAKPGRYVTITVSDTGTGIPPTIVNKIFEPFFTTKEHGKGTGLGLSTVLGILKGHGGFINVYSELGKGTRFMVYLPATEAEGLVPAEEAPSELPAGHGETVLVVDDEEAIREITKATLEKFGYEVLTANDGAEAVALYAANLGKIDAVLLDMMMPFMDGPATIRALQRLDQQVRVIGTSGLTENSKVFEASDAGVHLFLSKPYTAEALLKMLDRLLRGGA
jgi:PAS domain S-box-containing protein